MAELVRFVLGEGGDSMCSARFEGITVSSLSAAMFFFLCVRLACVFCLLQIEI